MRIPFLWSVTHKEQKVISSRSFSEKRYMQGLEVIMGFTYCIWNAINSNQNWRDFGNPNHFRNIQTWLQFYPSILHFLIHRSLCIHLHLCACESVSVINWWHLFTDRQIVKPRNSYMCPKQIGAKPIKSCQTNPADLECIESDTLKGLSYHQIIIRYKRGIYDHYILINFWHVCSW
jgi:hypothetical protein